MRPIAVGPRLLALCAAIALLQPGLVQADPTAAQKAPTRGTAEYSSTLSEVDSCNQAQSRIPPNATVTAMRISTAIRGEYGTFTCRVKWSLSPSAKPTYRPILFSPSA
jgi:hypothetical protein